MAKKVIKKTETAPKENGFDAFLTKNEPPVMVSLQVEVNKELFHEAKLYKKVDGYTWTTIVEAGLRAFIDSCEKKLDKRLKEKKT